MKKDVELRAEGLSLLHPQEDGTSRGLLPFSASFRPGRLHLVEGESGSGKTTLLSLLGLLEAPGEGRVTLGGQVLSSPSSKERDLRKGRRSFSLCLRELDYLPSLTLRENLRLAGGDLAKGERVLADLGLGERLGERAALLSTGELQRLSLALALMSPAPVLLLDEPTANLDEGRRAIALRLIEREAASRVVVLAAHDYRPAEGGARPRRILLEDGRAVLEEEGEGEDVEEGAVGEHQVGVHLLPFGLHFHVGILVHDQRADFLDFGIPLLQHVGDGGAHAGHALGADEIDAFPFLLEPIR